MRKLAALALLATALSGCAAGGGAPSSAILLNGTTGLENFNRVSQADWAAIDGAIQATQGGAEPAYLVSKKSYTDFTLRVEFWASDDANSGVFLRCQNPEKITDETCYEANIFDQRPEPTYGTGAIVKIASVAQPAPKAGGRWNTYEITARGTHLVLVLNGRKTVDMHNERLASGPFALQWARGTIKFRKIKIEPLKKNSIYDLDLSAGILSEDLLTRRADIRCGRLEGQPEDNPVWPMGYYKLADFKITRPRGEGYDQEPPDSWPTVLLPPGHIPQSELQLFEELALKPNLGKRMCFLGAFEGLGQYPIYYAVRPEHAKSLDGRSKQ